MRTNANAPIEIVAGVVVPEELIFKYGYGYARFSQYGPALLRGLSVTVFLTIVVILAALVLAIPVALIRSPNMLLRGIGSSMSRSFVARRCCCSWLANFAQMTILFKFKKDCRHYNSCVAT